MRTGVEAIFTGEAGATTYLLSLAAVLVVYLCRIAFSDHRNWYGSFRVLCAGFALLLVSRSIHVTAFYNHLLWVPLLSLLSGLAGLYCLFVSVFAQGQGEEKSLRGRVLLAGGLVGAICGGTLFLVISKNLAAGVILHLFIAVAGFMPAGMFVASLWWSSKAPRRGMLFTGMAGFFLVAATGISTFRHLGLVGPEPFWMQLFSLVDLAGVFFLLVSSLFGPDVHRTDRNKEIPIRIEPRNATVSGSSGSYDPGSVERMATLNYRIASDEAPQEIYDDIVRYLADEIGAEAVLLMMARSGDGFFKVESFAGEMTDKDISPSTFRITREVFLHLCPDEHSGEEPFLIPRDTTDDALGELVPSGFEREGKQILIYPVAGSGSVHGFFTVGYFDGKPPDTVCGSINRYANCLMLVVQRERLRERLLDKEKTLVICKEELNSVNELKSNFLSIISHELRTPLTSVKAYTETLLDNVATIRPETLRDFLKVMDEENERLIRLIDNILNYSCMEMGNLKVERTSCDLSEMIEEVHKSLQNTFLRGKVNSDLRLPKNHIMIEADRELIRQLMVNLMNNAVKFTPTMGRVTITLEEEASAVRIVVQDTGKGIPEDQLEKIFERFHQVDTSDTREHGGSGLGLAICKTIVEWHDGKIWVENVKEAGARFVVLLPRKDIVVRQAPATGFIGSIRFEKERYLTLLVEMLAEFVQARKASIMQIDEDDEQYLRIIAAKGLDPEFVQNTKLEVGERFAGRVAQTGESLHVSNIEKDVEIGRANNTAYYGTTSFISVPLKDGNEIIGVLNVSDHVDGREFSNADRELIESLGVIIVGMLKKLDAYMKITSNFEKLKAAMQGILDIREAWGSRNLFNYTQLALETGRKLSLDEPSLTALRLGMNIYDLGMMKVPRNIRMKKEELDEKDWDKLKQHTNKGYSLISPMGLEDRIMRMVRSHHENFDGSGYPDGLVGVEIPTEARIVNVVDSFRALIMPGPYRRRFTIEEARNEVLRNAGTKFDPKVVGAFLKALDEMKASEHRCELVLEALDQEYEAVTASEQYDEQASGEELVKEEPV
ncbi:MAG: GAF domain-containing protein [bacterium]|nr:MAG: GAF domain-containing protein [bacterium]